MPGTNQPATHRAETADARLKRLTMRSWRRGTKEMDLILGSFADARLAGMGRGTLGLYDALLCENDQDLYPWITAALPAPDRFAPLIAEIAAFAQGRQTLIR